MITTLGRRRSGTSSCFEQVAGELSNFRVHPKTPVLMYNYANVRGQERMFHDFLKPKQPGNVFSPKEYWFDAQGSIGSTIRDPLYEVLSMRVSHDVSLYPFHLPFLSFVLNERNGRNNSDSFFQKF